MLHAWRGDVVTSILESNLADATREADRRLAELATLVGDVSRRVNLS